jgi:tetratricopeptide (TPR) repeat protein
VVSSRYLDLYELAKDKFEKKQYTLAEKYLNQILLEDNSASEVFFLLGSICHNQGHFSKAIFNFKKTLELDPDHTEAAISLSILYNDLGRYSEAKHIFTEAKQRLEHKDVDPHLQKKFAQKHIEIGDMYLKQGLYDETMEEYIKAQRLDPSSLKAELRMGKLEATRGEWSKAVSRLTRLRNTYPRYMPIRLNLGLLFYSQGKIMKAYEEWERILAFEPSNQEAKLYLQMANRAKRITM